MLHAEVSLESLRETRGNSLDKPSKDRRGQSSIRINDQFRVCFRWKDGKTYEVEIVDYH
jgi:toxin HigB-1